MNDANDVSAKALFEEGLILHKNGSLSQASAIFEQVLKLQPEYVEALHLLGVIASQSNNQLLALDLIDKAISINSSYSVLFNNRGNILYTLNRLEEALVSYETAINLKKDYADAYYNRGNALKDLKRFDEALVSYDQAINLRNDHPEAYNNRGIVLNYLNHFEEALASYNKAIYLQEDYADAYFNSGNILYKLKRFNVALASYDQVIKLNGKFALEAHFRRGGLLWELGRLDESLESYSYVIQSNIEFDFLHGAWFYVKRFICDWLHEKNKIAKLVQEITYNEKKSHPFTILFLMDSLTIQLKSAEIWINANYPENHELLPLTKRPRDKKIRIGYYSSDFYNHATTYLMAELFELHDKNKFELIAFSFGIEQKDEMRKRVSAAFDQFIDIRDKSDKEVALLSRSIGIDIAIDLKGFTRDARTGIFSYRAAPIQVNYMGYPATMGASYIDYIVADKTLIPNASQQFYSEKVVYLPNSYQVNDSRRQIAGRKIPREKLGLPTTGFVFCCFNNNYKITPNIFDCWMRILIRVEGSVLWLLEDNLTAANNLRREASARGISIDRLVFAKRMPLPEHLARHHAADLFIDTLPCNAHTTASDALWAGLPVLTCIGESFSGRVAASLLNAIDLGELITSSKEEYEALAVYLATNPMKLRHIKKKLEKNILTTALFDSALYTEHIESAYIQMYENYHADILPSNIFIN